MEPGKQFAFFHGTTQPLKPGDVISPGHHPMFPSVTDTRYAYATAKPDDAWHYAELAWNAADSGVPRVYRVSPLGRHSHDPQVDTSGHSRGNFSGDRRSKHGWRVEAEEPMPENMGDPEDWK